MFLVYHYSFWDGDTVSCWFIIFKEEPNSDRINPCKVPLYYQIPNFGIPYNWPCWPWPYLYLTLKISKTPDLWRQYLYMNISFSSMKIHVYHLKHIFWRKRKCSRYAILNILWYLILQFKIVYCHRIKREINLWRRKVVNGYTQHMMKQFMKQLWVST